MNESQYIVVGSGPSGVHAAQTLVEAGKQVLMLDAGTLSGKHAALPEGDFFFIRKQYEEQFKIWVGEDFSGIPLENNSQGLQLTPARQFVISDGSSRVESSSFFPLESPTRGGLGNAWGLGCYVFSDQELRRCGLPVTAMRNSYQAIADRIGISSADDDVKRYTAEKLLGLQPSIEIDSNAAQVLKAYDQNKHRLNQAGHYLGKPCLAVITREKDGRDAVSYDNLDFYHNRGDSAWRPEITLRQLESKSNFTYLGGHDVRSFSESGNGVEISTGRTPTGAIFRCKKLLLACNVISTARIVANSFNEFSHRFPILCNPHTFIALLQKNAPVNLQPRSSAAQLMMFHDPDGQNVNVSTASLYSYSSLMLFRIIRNSPFNFRDSRRILQWLAPRLIIAGVYQPDEPSTNKYLQLGNSEGMIRANYSLTAAESKNIRDSVDGFARALTALGCRTLKKIARPAGSSYHYAGTLAFSEKELPFHLLPDGRLGGCANIYVADGSGLRYLPAKGISLTLMANAHRTALNAMQYD